MLSFFIYYLFNLHNSLDVVYAAIVDGRNDVALNSVAVNSHGLDALLRACGVVNLDNVGRAAELSGNGKALHIVGDTGVNHKTCIVSTDAENVLRNIEEGPGSSTGEPAILSLAVILSVTTCDHLRIYIRLGAVNITDVLKVSGADLGVDLECSVAATDNGLSNGDPGVVVAEDTCIFLISGRIGGNLTEVEVIGLIGRLLENDTVLGVKSLLDRIKSLLCVTFLYADTCKYAEALGLNEDLTFLTLGGADLIAECIVSAEEPVAVPAILKNSLVHLVDFSLSSCGLFVETLELAHFNIVLADSNKLTCDKYRFSHAALIASGGLEGLAGSLGEAVEVEAVVPVSTTDEGETVRSEVVYNVVKGSLQVVDKGLRSGGIGIERGHVIENVDITGLLDVSGNTEGKPHGVIVEAVACVTVALLGKGLILMVSRAVLKLNGSNINNSLACILGNEVDKACEVLAGITEAHAATDAAFKVRSRTGHIKCNHALILVPDVDHTCKLFVLALYLIAGEEVYPVFLKLCKSSVKLLCGIKLSKHFVSRLLVDNVECFPLVVLVVLAVAETENVFLGLAGLKLNSETVRADRCPAACDGVTGLALKNSIGLTETVVKTEEGLAVGIKALDGSIYGEDSVVVSSLSVLSLVINGAADNLNFTDGEVSLEVGHIIVCVPETELNEAEKLKALLCVGSVCKGNLVKLAGAAHRYHRGLGSLDTALFGSDLGITETVTALIRIKLSLDGLPCDAPNIVVIVYVEVTSACIGGYVVVAITGKSEQSCILVEAVTAGSVGEQSEEVLTAEIVDPRVRCIGTSYAIFTGRIVKKTVFHVAFLLKFMLD